MKCKLCLIPIKPAQSVDGYCLSCNILRQSMNMHEEYMHEAEMLPRLLEYFQVRTEIVRAKILILNGEP